MPLHAFDYSTARLLLQRGLGLVYLIAFAVSLAQFPALLGEKGLLPVRAFLLETRFRDSPSLFHFRYSDRLLIGACVLGIVLAFAVVMGVPDDWPVWLTMATWLILWLLYRSIVNVGQTFYAFGWESLLLEAGFLAVFLGPAWTAVPFPILLLFRWLLVRLELGAGLIKIRGDPCWRELTCLDWHHETQPMPNPLSWYAHQMPKWFHRLEAIGSHFAQLVVPVFLFFPQPIAGIAALWMALTQSWLLATGNYAWLNLITIVLAASAVPDFGTHELALVPWFDALALGYTAIAVGLSYNPIRNLVSKRQVMNRSFEPLHLVNTYGAFGSVTRERLEVAIEGRKGRSWVEYEFKGKPSDPMKKPRQFAPWHLRLDWLMWFAAISPSYAQEWFIALVEKLLRNDEETLRLFARNPFPDGPPDEIRATLWHYRFTTWKERRATGAWWVRTPLGIWFPPISLDESSGAMHSALHETRTSHARPRRVASTRSRDRGRAKASRTDRSRGRGARGAGRPRSSRR